MARVGLQPHHFSRSGLSPSSLSLMLCSGSSPQQSSLSHFPVSFHLAYPTCDVVSLSSSSHYRTSTRPIVEPLVVSICFSGCETFTKCSEVPLLSFAALFLCQNQKSDPERTVLTGKMQHHQQIVSVVCGHRRECRRRCVQRCRSPLPPSLTLPPSTSSVLSVPSVTCSSVYMYL